MQWEHRPGPCLFTSLTFAFWYFHLKGMSCLLHRVPLGGGNHKIIQWEARHCVACFNYVPTDCLCVVILYSLLGHLWLPGMADWVRAPPQESSTFEVKVLISHLLGKVTEVFSSKPIKSPEPLTFVTTGSLAFQIVTIGTVWIGLCTWGRPWQKAKFLSRRLGWLFQESQRRDHGVLWNSRLSPSQVVSPKLSYDAGVQWL